MFIPALLKYVCKLDEIITPKLDHHDTDIDLSENDTLTIYPISSWKRSRPKVTTQELLSQTSQIVMDPMSNAMQLFVWVNFHCLG